MRKIRAFHLLDILPAHRSACSMQRPGGCYIMYSTCLFCRHPLGANGVLEHFPVGRRIAFDAAKGRLWVVCRHCTRWNLTPLEERWEAIEEAER